MKIQFDGAIKNSLNTDSKAKYLISIINKNCFEEFYNFLNEHDDMSVIVIGEGTNVVLPEYFDGAVVKISSSGLLPEFNKINLNIPTDIDKNTKICDFISVGALVNWDDLVKAMIKHNIYGFENLSGIPGSVGAAPLQNIGAYGQEISNLIHSVDCYDYSQNKFVNLSNKDCNFSYRNSSIKNKPYIIYNVNFYQSKQSYLNPKLDLDYESIKLYLDDHDINPQSINPSDVRNIILSIRSQKLPNYIYERTVGSFFKNPIVKIENIDTTRFSLNHLILWKIDEITSKVGAARLIELIKNDLDDYENVYLSNKHSLVLCTNGRATQNEILKFASHIQEKIFSVFNINLEIEPTVIKN